MPSRKRNKGQARKARAAAASQSNSQQQHQQQPSQPNLAASLPNRNSRICIHGGTRLTPGHAVARFFDTFYGHWGENSIGQKMSTVMTSALDETYALHRDVWSCDQNRAMAIAHLISSGTTSLLIDDAIEGDGGSGTQVAGTVAVNQIARISTLVCQKETCLKYSTSSEHSIIEFYSERVPCQCLDHKMDKRQDPSPRRESALTVWRGESDGS